MGMKYELCLRQRRCRPIYMFVASSAISRGEMGKFGTRHPGCVYDCLCRHQLPATWPWWWPGVKLLQGQISRAFSTERPRCALATTTDSQVIGPQATNPKPD